METGQMGNKKMTAASTPDDLRPSGKRGRPSRAQEKLITEQIIEAGLRLFLAQGYGATSMKGVGEEAGVAPNTLYARFPDKQTLFAAIVEWKVATWKVTNPPKRVRAGASLEETLEASALNMLEAVEREDIRAFSRLLAMEADRFPELAQIYHENTFNVARPEAFERLRQAENGNLSDQDIEDLLLTLRETVIGFQGGRIFQTRETPTLRATARRIARVLANGWTTKARPPRQV